MKLCLALASLVLLQIIAVESEVLADRSKSAVARILFIAPDTSKRVQLNEPHDAPSLLPVPLPVVGAGDRLPQQRGIGWHVEADKPHAFNVFLAVPSTKFKNNTSSSSSTHNHVGRVFYMFFTLDERSCDDYLHHTHIPVYINVSRHRHQQQQQQVTVHKVRLDVQLPYAGHRLSHFICLSRHSSLINDADDADDDEGSDDEGGEASFLHQGTSNQLLAIVTYARSMPVWTKVTLYVVMIALNSIFNGLNLGLMALSVEELELLVKTSESSKERKYAKNILPLRRKRNYLLCSILLSVTLTSSISTLILGIYI